MIDKIWAYHPGGVVVEIVSLPAIWTPGTDIYLPARAADMTDVTALSPRPELGWITQDSGRSFAVPPAEKPVDLVAYANARQWALATGGFVATIKGAPVPFSTSESALGLIDGKVMRLAQPNAPTDVNWQVGPTTFVSIAADDFVHAATLVSDFVQATFDALPAIFAAIAAGTITTTAAVDAATWPVASGAVS